MDIRNHEFDQTGAPIVGATVTVYTATLTHPPVTVETAGTTNGDGMWAFTGLAEGSHDVRVVANGQTKWYKGKTQYGVAAMFFETPARFLQVATPSAPGAGSSLAYFKADGLPYYRSGAAGAETKLADYASATGVLRATGWGTVQTADIGAGQVATTSLAANAATQIAQADGSTSSPTTTSTTFVDMPEMTVTLTTLGGPLLCLFDAACYASAALLSSSFGFSLDGAAAVHRRDYNLGSGNVTPMGMVHRFTGVAAGSHTVKVQWLISSGTLTCFGTERSLIVEELKR